MQARATVCYIKPTGLFLKYLQQVLVHVFEHQIQLVLPAYLSELGFGMKASERSKCALCGAAGPDQYKCPRG